MKAIYKTIDSLQDYLADQSESIGFIPTMGALHDGHLELVRRSINDKNITIASIYVNPTQFNDLEDFNNYPVTVEDDIRLLESVGCDILFLPSTENIYPNGTHEILDYNNQLFDVLEGKYRPGHFAGMVTVVKRLLDIIKPDKAYFGLKDYQQFKIVEKLVDFFGLKTEVIGVSIVRDEWGLALSSRNTRLSKKGIKKARYINRVLNELVLKYNYENHDETIRSANYQLEKLGIKVEYISFRDTARLDKVNEKSNSIIALFAGYVEGVRLIDNVNMIIS